MLKDLVLDWYAWLLILVKLLFLECWIYDIAYGYFVEMNVRPQKGEFMGFEIYEVLSNIGSLRVFF